MAPTKSKAKTGTSSSAPETPEVSDTPSQASKVKQVTKQDARRPATPQSAQGTAKRANQWICRDATSPSSSEITEEFPQPSPAERSKGKAKVAAPILSGEDARMGHPPLLHRLVQRKVALVSGQICHPEDDEPTEQAKKSPSPQASSPVCN
ncbi:hypothetical protein BC834DRAFT_976640 [Gloeopeniophorella convolvens]|nr:hypothetical protein BC834DRAFT_976640 [Gloeopeniophorella convolvens]